ncbi:ubiquitin carboxyl-terminal hydrolase family protein [Artemisia annua]|uniref:Ubiquitin carboxyl-terminal hydrolase family protein n=1 Tax=Artemisia annua TaxID=35608 RepID=A0A2U1M6A8_ARTAN|nr:ubiquitin carboxyl-terminal hydrolase family protein [Artemisia annua]
MMFLVDMQEPVVVERLAKLLMMVSNQRLNLSKLYEVGRSLGLPDDYLIRIIPEYLDIFRVISYSGRKSSMEIERIKWECGTKTWQFPPLRKWLKRRVPIHRSHVRYPQLG